MFEIDNKTDIFIPTGRTYNPITKTNWDNIGVKPDIKINSSIALKNIIKRIINT